MSSNVTDQFHSMDLNTSGASTTTSAKKRPKRAFHTDFNQPTSVEQFQQQQQSLSPFYGQTLPFPPSTHASPAVHQEPPHLQDATQEETVPSIQATRYANQQEYDTPDAEGSYKSFLTFSNTVPPEAGTQFHVTDQGTASSKFIRSTMYYVPESEKLRSATKLPLAVTIRPFAPQLSSEEPVQLVEFQQTVATDDDPLSIGPVRCHRCRAYINPSMQFTHNQKFICNICQFANNLVPQEYAVPLDSRGYRVDKFIRPELHNSCYDITVPQEYNFNAKKKSEPLHIVFLIDLSENSIKQNLPGLISDSIRSTLFQYNSNENGNDNENEDENEDENENENENEQKQKKEPIPYKISIMAFDKRIYFFNLSSKLEKTQISISSDLDDPFVPFDEGLFASPTESQFVIEDALNTIEQWASTSKTFEIEPCFASACKTAGLCLEMHGGGKIVSVLSNLPSWGPGGLKYKDNKAVGRTPSPEVEKKIFHPDNAYWKSMTKDFIKNSVGMDLFVVAHSSVDLSNIGYLVSSTGGEISRWTNFNLERDARLFTAKFKSSVLSTTGYQGQLKLRCSNGLQVAQYYGTSSSSSEATLAGSVQDPIIPILSQNQSFTLLLKYDGLLSKKLDCHFQAALLYTDPRGVRKVRIINLVLAVATKLDDVFYFTDENAIITTLVRDTLSFIGNQTLNELRESLNTKLVEIFTHYRAMNEYGYGRARTFSNKLLFPDALKNLPLHILSFLKTNAIKSATGSSADTRLAEAYNMLTMPIERLMYYLYPALVELHSLDDEDGTIDDTTEFTIMPRYKELTAKNLDRGVYILCDGQRTWVWVDPDSNIMLIKDLFGEQYESVDQLDALMDELPDSLPSDISQQARNIVYFFNKNIVGVDSSSVHIVRKGVDGAEHHFRELLRDDSLGGAIKAANGPSFSEYLTSLHQAIKHKDL
ncbi:uncharacterized protein LODBEIA_P46200 [Lodderomyces beijingensis]|uniref:SED5-binding protein 3 n=1 Tax=Lodderomyces beijingensis TaxID=1775926 RepID=A0ABP0ZTV7_9ASCO